MMVMNPWSSQSSPIPAEEVRKAVLNIVPPRTVEANSKAFDFGKEAGSACLEF